MIIVLRQIGGCYYKDDKVVATGTSVLSKDGKVLTITTKGTDASGKPFNSVAVYDKQ